AAIERSEVAHLAVHLLVDDTSSFLAALVLAEQHQPRRQSSEADGGPAPENGLVYLKDVFNLDLSRTRLVVMSTCQSAIGSYDRGEGTVGLVRAFIKAGVPTVVATMWPVESEVTEELMVRFHEERRGASRGVADALRRAQLETASGGNFSHPYYWAA